MIYDVTAANELLLIDIAEDDTAEEAMKKTKTKKKNTS
jgi:hypothetical protein